MGSQWDPWDLSDLSDLYTPELYVYNLCLSAACCCLCPDCVSMVSLQQQFENKNTR